jgi:hypothetical protein
MRLARLPASQLPATGACKPAVLVPGCQHPAQRTQHVPGLGLPWHMPHQKVMQGDYPQQPEQPAHSQSRQAISSMCHSRSSRALGLSAPVAAASAAALHALMAAGRGRAGQQGRGIEHQWYGNLANTAQQQGGVMLACGCGWRQGMWHIWPCCYLQHTGLRVGTTGVLEDGLLLPVQQCSGAQAVAGMRGMLMPSCQCHVPASAAVLDPADDDTEHPTGRHIPVRLPVGPAALLEPALHLDRPFAAFKPAGLVGCPSSCWTLPKPCE